MVVIVGIKMRFSSFGLVWKGFCEEHKLLLENGGGGSIYGIVVE